MSSPNNFNLPFTIYIWREAWCRMYWNIKILLQNSFDLLLHTLVSLNSCDIHGRQLDIHARQLDFAKCISTFCLSSNTNLVTTHIRGKLNRGPDLLSREKETEFSNGFLQMDRWPLDIPHRLSPTISEVWSDWLER